MALMPLLLRLAPICVRRRGSSEAIEAIAAGGVGGSACAVIVEVLGVRGRQHLSSGAWRAFLCALVSLAGGELSAGGMGWWRAGRGTLGLGRGNALYAFSLSAINFTPSSCATEPAHAAQWPALHHDIRSVPVARQRIDR